MQYDPFDPATHADPDPAFAALRERCPVHHDRARHFYTVARTDLITEILRTPQRWSSRFRNGLAYRPPVGEPMLLDADPPTHTWQRRLLQKAWTPRLINRLEPRVQAVVDERFDSVAPQGQCDFHAAIAAPVPTIMIAELVGVPVADRPRFRAWSDARVQATGGMPGHEQAEAAATAEMADYLRHHIVRRRDEMARGGAVPEDFTTMMLMVDHEGRRLTDDEALQVLQLLLIGGIETTTLLLTNLLHRVIIEPGLAGQLRAQPGLVDTAVEESLRLDSPTLGLFRTPNEDVVVADVAIPKDAKTMVLFAAVNRDPALWDEPDRFRLDRDPSDLRRHFAFGHGIHLCLGAPLARLEGRVVLQAIVDRLVNVRYQDPPSREANMIFRGFDHQPIAWGPCSS